MENIVTCIAPVNIAVIKYWGKRDEKLILPINDSISATLSTEQLCAKTTVMASPNFNNNRFWLNGKEENFNNERLRNCLKEVKKRVKLSNSKILNWNLHICSENNFPTAAGLASSAAGYACLVSALADLYQIEGDISQIARQGSGSACRSVYGGWVQWHSGTNPDGSDSVATQLFDENYWPQMRILILVVSDQKKYCSSSKGMTVSVNTSELLKYRAQVCVPQRVKEMKKALGDKNFDEFAKITMQDSNQFHGVLLDSYPPIVYMNDISHLIVKLVHSYNKFYGKNKVAYTFDAGPNACLYLLEDTLEEFLALINKVFPPPNKDSKTNILRGGITSSKSLDEKLLHSLELPEKQPGALKYIIQTKVGGKPILSTNSADHLLGENGIPKNI